MADPGMLVRWMKNCAHDMTEAGNVSQMLLVTEQKHVQHLRLLFRVTQRHYICELHTICVSTKLQVNNYLFFKRTWKLRLKDGLICNK